MGILSGIYLFTSANILSIFFISQGRLHHQKGCGEPQGSFRQCEQCGVRYECASDVCCELYVGETARSLEERVEEHGRSIERPDSKSF